MADRIRILTTRPLPEHLLSMAEHAGVKVDTTSFIETTPALTPEVVDAIQLIKNRKTLVLFTSMNAVEVVTQQLNGFVPEWRIYCIGQTTQQLLQDYFGSEAIVGTAPNAALLAELIMLDCQPQEINFFCGNQRRDELPTLLHAANWKVNEIVVYNTIETAQTITEEYDGMLFYSPSAVTSFFSVNQLPERTLLFAIGDTTANAIKTYSSNNIIIGQAPGKEQLFLLALDHFSSQNS